jgi:hypothetical protein
VVSANESSESVGLRANAVSLWGDFVVSVANVAPSSTVAFTPRPARRLHRLGLAAGRPDRRVREFLVSMGYASLNRWKPSAGAPYVWVSEAISPTVGYGTGFLNALTSTLANVGNITLAGG